MRGAGLQPSWPDGWGVLALPIDHVLHIGTRLGRSQNRPRLWLGASAGGRFHRKLDVTALPPRGHGVPWGALVWRK
jgi:hypothetical protein